MSYPVEVPAAAAQPPIYPPPTYGQPGYAPPAYGQLAGSSAATPMAAAAPGAADSTRSLGELIGGITTDLSTLMRQEVELAKAELQQSAKRAGKGAGMFGGAGFAGYFVLVFLSIALWWALGATGMGLGWSALIVAVIWGVIGFVLVQLGRSEFKSVRGLDRTAETVKKIPNAVKGNEEENR